MFLPNDIYSNKHKRSDGIRLHRDGEGVLKLVNDDGMIMNDDEKPVTSVAGLYRLYQRESSYQTMLYQHHQCHHHHHHHPKKQFMHHASNDSLSTTSTKKLSSDSTSTTTSTGDNFSPRGEVTTVYSNDTLSATVSLHEDDDNEVANDEKLAEIAIAMARRMREKHCTTIPRRDSVYLDDVIYSSVPSLSLASGELFGDFIMNMADEALAVSSSSSIVTSSKQRSIFSLEEKSAAALFKVGTLQHQNSIKMIDALPTVVDLDLSSADMYNNDNDSLSVSSTYSTTEGSRNHVSPFRGLMQQQNTCPPSIDNPCKKTKGDDIVPQLTLEECTSFESSSSSTISPSSLIKSPAHVNLASQAMSAGRRHLSTKSWNVISVVVALCIGIFGLHHIDSRIVTQHHPTSFVGIVPTVIEPFHSVLGILSMASNLAIDYEDAAASMSLIEMNDEDDSSFSPIGGMTTSLFCGGDSRSGDMTVELWNMINI
jgi:hypothetical protein